MSSTVSFRSRRLLLTGVSALTLFAVQSAHAQVLSTIRATPATAQSGGGGTAAGLPGAAPRVMSPSDAQQKTARSAADLAAAVAAVRTQLSAQAQARVAAQSATSSVPNGLAPGGLAPAAAISANPLLWQNAKAPAQAVDAGGQTTVTIEQTAQKAILTWDSFNIGRDTTVHFDQTGGTQANGANNWIALNRVVDPSGKPSQILGRIKAEGSVYLINQNGILFGGASQVDTHALVASSLSFLGEKTAGLTPGTAAWDQAVANSNLTFLATGVAGPEATGGTGNSNLVLGLGGAVNMRPGAAYQPAGDITIAQGASISTHGNGAQGNGGYVLIAGTNVSNAGQISTPDGQAILAAGVGVGFWRNPVNGSAVLLPKLTGRIVNADSSDGTPISTLTNTGLVQASRGTVNLLGTNVAQNGAVLATTGISYPGRIVISAVDETIVGADSTDQQPHRIGLVSFGSGSVTANLPEEDGETATSSPTSSFTPGRISVTGGAVWFKNGSLLEAPGAAVSVAAMTTTGAGAMPNFETGLNAIPGRVYVDNGATIDVAGLTDVQLPASASLVTIKLITQNEIADDPNQTGLLNLQYIVLDSTLAGTTADGKAWVGSPILNAAGYAQLIPRKIDQLLVNAGSITLAGDQVLTAAGSLLNLDGGYAHYLGGSVATTRLIDSTGHIVAIGAANPNNVYVGVAGVSTVDHRRWGVTDTFSNSLYGAASSYRPESIAGGNGGALTVYGEHVAVLDGTMSAQAVAGINQAVAGRAPAGPAAGGGFLPTGGALDFGSGSSLITSGVDAFYGGPASAIGTKASIIIQDAAPALSRYAANFDISTAFDAKALGALDPNDPNNVLGWQAIPAKMLSAGGFAKVTINPLTASGSARNLVVAEGTTLSVQPGGTISYKAPYGGDITVLGRLIAPSGLISLETDGVDAAIAGPAQNFRPGDIRVGPGGVLSTAGLWVNDSGLLTAPGADAFVNGGGVSLSAGLGASITLDKGSLIDVSSGGVLLAGGLLTKNGVAVGKGGDVSLTTWNFHPTDAYGAVLPPAQPTAGALAMNGTIRSAGFSGGGKLTLQALGFQIGGDPAAAHAWDLALPETFFAGQGFGAYQLNAIYDTTVADGAQVRLTQKTLIADPAALAAAPSGTDLAAAGLVGLGQLDAYHRQATNLTLTAGGDVVWGALQAYAGVSNRTILGKGATIDADPGAAVTLGGVGGVTVLGAIRAPGGAVTLTGDTGSVYAKAAGMSSGIDFTTPDKSVWLGSNAVLDVSGVALTDPYAKPVNIGGALVQPTIGKVLNGGTVTLSDAAGYVVAEAGSLINVSGASAVFDQLQAAPDGTTRYAPGPAWSNAGAITLGAGNGLFFDGAFKAAGGAPQAQGGALTLLPETLANNGATTYQGQISNAAGASGLILQQSGALVPAGLTPGQAIVNPGQGAVVFAVDRLKGSGIDTLVLGGPSSNRDASPIVAFAGGVDLNLGRAVVVNASQILALPAGAVAIPQLAAGTANTGGASVSIAAPYVALAGRVDSHAASLVNTAAMLGDATLSINAGFIDISNQAALGDFAKTSLVSRGDIRLSSTGFTTDQKGLAAGLLFTPGDLTLQAASVYPASGERFVLAAVGPNPTTITFQAGGASSTPLSAGGALLVDATNIVQGGALRAPFGAIVLGVGDPTDASVQAAFGGAPLTATQSVTLAAGGLTSVSAGTATLPYGVTTDGTNWSYPGQPNGVAPTLTAPPAKVVTLNGRSVSLQAGANVDLSGGGVLQASEWVPGAGGTRDLLSAYNVSYAGGATGATVPLYPDARNVYAVVPGYSAPVAAYDPVFAQQADPTSPGRTTSLGVGQAGAGDLVGKAVYLSGVPGLPAGIYTLLPAKYATMPGAFRVVQQTGAANVAAGQGSVLADGTNVVAGYFADALSGARRATPSLFSVQSAAVWGKASEYRLTDADSFFAAQAKAAGTVAPALARDAGQLVLAATGSLSLGSTLNTAAGKDGAAGKVDIASQDIQIVGAGQTALAGYLQLSASDLDALGAGSLLIGGVRSQTAKGVAINVVSNSVVVSNDAAHPLTAPEILLVAKSDPTATDPNAANGLWVQSGGVIAASGSLPAGGAQPILIGDASHSGDGALLRVSNGGQTGVIRSNVGANPQGLLTVAAGASIDGGAALTLDSSGGLNFDPAARFAGSEIAVDAPTITFTNAANPAGLSGFVVGPNGLAQFASAKQVDLRSFGDVVFDGDVSLNFGQAVDLSAGRFVGRGQVSLTGSKIAFTNDLGAPTTAVSAGANTGRLTVAAAEIDLGAGSKSLAGFGAVTVAAAGGVIGQGSGAFDLGGADATFAAPVFLADTGSATSLTTTGALTLNGAGGTALALKPIGGAFSFKGGAVTVNGATLSAPAGNVSLEATSGDLVVASGSTLSSTGLAKTFYDTVQYAPGGIIKLTADKGLLDVQAGSTLDVSGAAGGGAAGGLTLSAPGRTVQLAGVIKGAAAAGYAGGSLSLDTGGAVDLDNLAGLLAASGVNSAVTVHTRAGNLTLSAGRTIRAQAVSLTADGGAGGQDPSGGNILVAGTIDASGSKGGQIKLYGKSGVDLEGALLATGSSAVKRGGSVEIGTVGVPDTVGGVVQLDPTYGYELVSAANSGVIRLGDHALIDVSGGAAGGLSGGVVNIRAPLLANGDVNVVVSPSAQIKGSRATTLEAFAVWSTTDPLTYGGGKHFDGLVDPAGWYNADGSMAAGTWTDQSGNALASPTPDQLASYLSQYYFTPTAPNAAHQSFYGYLNGDAAQGSGTLMGYIRNLPVGPAVNARFANVANFQVAPGVELANPDGTVNGGGVTVLSNWNLGAGRPNNSGSITPAYRYKDAIAPYISFRAVGDFVAKASITDGFFQSQVASILGAAGSAGSGGTYDQAQSLFQQLSATDNPASVTVQFADGTNQSLTGLDPNALLGAPLKNQAPAYYGNYLQYANAWGADMSAWADPKYAGFMLPITPLRIAAPIPTNYASYTEYLTAYYGDLSQSGVNNGGWLFGYSRFTVTGGASGIFAKNFPRFGTPTAPVLSSNPTDYAAYVHVYLGYLDVLTMTRSFQNPNITKPWNSYNIWFAPDAPLSIPYTGVNIGDLPGNAPAAVASLNNPLPIAFASLLGGQSSSYRIVAGANAASADPLGGQAVSSAAVAGKGDVSLDGHFAYVDSNSQTLYGPTTIRTGTGSIAVAAANDMSLLDQTAPGVIYTAGAPAAGAPVGTAASIVKSNGFGVFDLLATTSVNPDSAGDVSIRVGGDILGVENVQPSGNSGLATGQFWLQWMQTGNARSGGKVTQSSINFGAFDQGVMSVGGDVAISAGGDIQNLSVSLPTTWYLSNGGQTANTVGGGDLKVTAGGDILAGAYFVAKGTGVIAAGGQIASGGLTTPASQAGAAPIGVSTILAVQDGALNVVARQGVDIGAVVNPSYIQGSGLTSGYSPSAGPAWLADAQSYSGASAVNIATTTGDVVLNSLPSLSLLGAGRPGTANSDASNILPATVALTAFDGGVTIARAGQLYPSAVGQLSLIADRSVVLLQSVAGGGNAADLQFGLIDASPSTLPSPLSPSPIALNTASGVFDFNLTSAALVDHSPTPLHANDAQPVRIYSLNGDIVDGLKETTGPSAGFYDRFVTVVVDKPAQIYAGGDIVNLDFLGQNLRQNDITRIVAGRDIAAVNPLFNPSGMNTLNLAGPGVFDVEAGRNINLANPYELSAANPYANFTVSSVAASGIIAVGNAKNPYLPHAGADIDVLFGVGPGVANDAFVKAYVDPAVAGPDVQKALVAYMKAWDEGTGVYTGLVKDQPSVTMNLDKAWSEFQALPAAAQQRFNRQVLFSVLAKVGIDYNDPASSYFHQYARGYQAINTLFPAAMGYTANSLSGGVQGALTPVRTGDLDLRGSTVQTQQGGDVSILGPGGRALIGASAAPAAYVNTDGMVVAGPSNMGVLTLEQGTISMFTDTSVLLAQSRIFTEQGGAIMIWSSNGDINAGKGSKTTADMPEPIYVCDANFYCTRDARGAVTGAGIATLQTIPGAPSADVETVAPRGTVDFGAAGIRSSGNLIVAAQFVANVANVDVKGQTVGVPTQVANVLGNLSASSAAASAVQEAAQAMQQSRRNERPSIISVSIIGFGLASGDCDPAGGCPPR